MSGSSGIALSRRTCGRPRVACVRPCAVQKEWGSLAAWEAIGSCIRGGVPLPDQGNGLPRLAYKGVFKEGEVYGVGDAVTHQGSLWIALRATTQPPGLEQSADRSWQLACKKGRDGKDARP